MSPPKIAGLVQDLDREVDRLVGRALERQWSRLEFREERLVIGQLAAKYLKASRAEAGWSDIDLDTIWSWADIAEEDGERLNGDTTAYLQPTD